MLGRILENYKNWYLSWPKLVRIALLPGFISILGAWLQIFPVEAEAKWWWGLTLLFLLGVAAYNQLIEADEREECARQLGELSTKADLWRQRYADASILAKCFSTLVLDKSEMWLKAVNTAKAESVDAGRAYIRKENGLQINIDRIIVLIYQAFKHHTDAAAHEAIRVAFLVPDEKKERLALLSWCNQDYVTPHSMTDHPDAFSARGNSLASFVWMRTSQENFYFLDDVPKYCNATKPEEGVFTYLNNGQASSIKSIFCYRVVDGLSRNCLGVICVHSNALNMFQGRISEDVCRDVVSSAASRIIYELSARV